MPTNRTAAPASYRTSGIAPLALATLLAAVGVSVAAVALPTLAHAFAAPMSAVQWVVLAYLLAVTVSVVAAGRLGDLIGHRRVLLAGLVVFTAASLLCAAAPTLGLLVAARAVQGVAGAVLMALPIAIVRETVPKARTGHAMGLLATMSAVGTALGPALGGLAIASSGWRMVFLVLALAGLATMVLAARGLSAVGSPRTPQPTKSLDLLGTAVLALALTAYALAVTGGQGGFAAHGGLLLLGAAFGALAFVLVERRSTMPLVDLATLGDRATAIFLFTNLLVTTVMMATLVVGPFYLTFALGLDEAWVGLVLAVGPATAAASGVPAGRLTDAFGARRILVIAPIQMAIALVCLSLLPGRFGVAGYVLSLMALTPSFQLFLVANNTGLMMGAREDQRGMVSGLLGLSRNLGFITGASVMGAVFTAVLGTVEITDAAPESVGRAFSATFLVAAGLAVLTLLTTLFGRPAPDARAADGRST